MKIRPQKTWKTHPPLKRFNERYIPEPMSGCWLWEGFINDHGYGELSVNGHAMRAHIFSYWVFKGRVPKGKCVLHDCDVRCCVNPNHLHLGTRPQNSKEALARNRFRRGENHGMPTLTEVQVRAIRADQRVQRTIAADYGVNQMTVSNIKRRTTWGHVT